MNDTWIRRVKSWIEQLNKKFRIKSYWSLLPTACEGWGKVMFSVCSHPKGVPILAGGGCTYLGQVQTGGTYPSQGVPTLAWARWGVRPIPARGVPTLARFRWGYLPWPGGNPKVGTLLAKVGNPLGIGHHMEYAAVGMPLAFTQEDFLVSQINSLEFSHNLVQCDGIHANQNLQNVPLRYRHERLQREQRKLWADLS